MSLLQICKHLKAQANPTKAESFARFFKTGPGEYAENDVFIGLTVPATRVIAKQFVHLPFADIEELLKSKIHEERSLALMILVLQFQKGTEAQKKAIYQFYLRNTRYINNWDLVDLSARQIIGAYLFGKDASILYKLARSKSLWERRMAIVATHYFIIEKKYDHTFALAEILLDDKQDLIHKASGWMLREAAKGNQVSTENFLRKYHRKMPRTMLRYAIERFPEVLRKSYLTGRI